MLSPSSFGRKFHQSYKKAITLSPDSWKKAAQELPFWGLCKTCSVVTKAWCLWQRGEKFWVPIHFPNATDLPKCSISFSFSVTLIIYVIGENSPCLIDLRLFNFLLHFQISIESLFLSWGLSILLFFFWWGDLGLNSGLCTCKAGTLPLERHLQSIFLWLFWRWGLVKLFAWAGFKPRSSGSQLSKEGFQACATCVWQATFFFFLFLSVLGFEVRGLPLLGRHYHLGHVPTHY
jgi:hypothetical protein